MSTLFDVAPEVGAPEVVKAGVDYSKMDIEEQWEHWLAENPPEEVEALNDEQLKKVVSEDLQRVCNMSVGEYTLYQKWLEVQGRYPTVRNPSIPGDKPTLKDPAVAKILDDVKKNMWCPETVEDYLNLEPTLVYTDDSGTFETKGLEDMRGVKTVDRDKKLPEKWNALRTFSSTMKNNSNIGRNLNLFLQDRTTEKYLGVICISSDFLDLTPRDNWIGWEREKKTQGGMINYTAIGSTIVPTQPLGFNYVGGKLLALFCLSDTVQNLWKEQYGDTLVGVTTTSLYGKAKSGGLSQYDNLKHWKKMGYSAGSVSYETTRETQYHIRNWLHKYHTRKYFEWYVAKKPTGQPHKRDHRNRSYTYAYTKLGINKEFISSAHQRGIYFSPLYDNTREFLRSEISEADLVKSFDTSDEYLADLWKKKYASKRIKSLIKNDRVSDEVLFYSDLIYLSWEEVREKYLSDVGR